MMRAKLLNSKTESSIWYGRMEKKIIYNEMRVEIQGYGGMSLSSFASFLNNSRRIDYATKSKVAKCNSEKWVNELIEKNIDLFPVNF